MKIEKVPNGVERDTDNHLIWISDVSLWISLPNKKQVGFSFNELEFQGRSDIWVAYSLYKQTMFEFLPKKENK